MRQHAFLQADQKHVWELEPIVWSLAIGHIAQHLLGLFHPHGVVDAHVGAQRFAAP